MRFGVLGTGVIGSTLSATIFVDMCDVAVAA